MKRLSLLALLLAALIISAGAGTYRSEEYYYSVALPGDWELSDDSDATQIVLANAAEDAAVVIGVFEAEPGLSKDELVQAVVDRMRLKGQKQAVKFKGYEAVAGNYQFTMKGSKLIADLVVFNTKTRYFMLMGSSLKGTYNANREAIKAVFSSFTLDAKALDAAYRTDADGDGGTEAPVATPKPNTEKKPAEDKSKQYSVSVNWGDLENTFTFVKPDYLAAVKEGQAIVASGDLWAYYNVDTANDPHYTETFWARFFQDMYDKNYVRVANMVDWFKQKAKEKKWSSYELAVEVIKCVQTIPYERPYQVVTDQTQAASVLDYFTPNEIAWYNKGDCDTKSMLILMVLRQLGYDLVMYFSEYYQHAMAGININAKGLYKTYNGNKYYFVEATYPGWNIGDLPQEFGDPAKWTLVVIE
jgi:hypothetical protein